MRIHRRFPHSRFLDAVWIFVILGPTPSLAASLNDLTEIELLGPVKTVSTEHPQLRTVHHFDRNGRLVELILASTDMEATDSSRHILAYDRSGRLAEEHTGDASGQVSYKKIYRYGDDEQGRESAVVATTEDGILVHAAFWLYDDRGILLEEIEINGSGTAEKSLYDVRGNLIYGARFFQGRLVLESTHQYDPFGRLMESRYYASDSNLIRIDSYRYNAKGYRIEQHSEFLGSALLRKSLVTYEIDHEGNWTKETIQRWTKNNGAIFLSETTVSREREIEYYE